MSFDFGFGNLVAATLQSDVSSGDAVLPVTSTMANDVATALARGDVSRVPVVVSENRILAPGKRFEVVYATGADTDNATITVSRGQENTSAQAWSQGHYLTNRITQGVLDVLRAEIAGISSSGPLYLYQRFLYIGRFDATVDGDEVSADVPTGYRAFIDKIHFLPVDIQNWQATGSWRLGTTSGGSEINSGDYYGYLSATNRGRVWPGSTNIGYTGTFYIGTDFPDSGDKGVVDAYLRGEFEETA